MFFEDSDFSSSEASESEEVQTLSFDLELESDSLSLAEEKLEMVEKSDSVDNLAEASSFLEEWPGLDPGPLTLDRGPEAPISLESTSSLPSVASEVASGAAPLQCSICLEELTPSLRSVPSLPSVGKCHPIHYECASQLISECCPMCRSELFLDRRLSQKIKDNAKQAKLENDDYERLDILSGMSNLKYLCPMIQRETARSYLLALGIKKTKLRYDLDRAEGDAEGDDVGAGDGVIDIFSAIVTSTLESKRRELYKKDILKVKKSR